MFLPNKVKSIAAVSLLSLGALGSQALLASKAHAQSLVPMACNSHGRCEIRVTFNNWMVVDAVIVPNSSGIRIPRSLAKKIAAKGTTEREISEASTININSITIGNKKYPINTPTRIVSSGNPVLIGENTLEAIGARHHGNTNQLVFP